jgi:hypothetical protein
MAHFANHDGFLSEALGRASMRLRSSGIFVEKKRPRSLRAREAHARRKPGVFALA